MDNSKSEPSSYGMSQDLRRRIPEEPEMDGKRKSFLHRLARIFNNKTSLN